MKSPDAVHHRGPLAGLGAGAVAVLAVGGMILVAARRQFSEFATVVAWALMAAVIGLVIAAAVYVFLWLRHRFRYPETLAGWRPVRAEVLGEAPAPLAAIPAAHVAAIEPPRAIHLHFSGTDSEEYAARVVRRALTEPVREEITP